MHQNAHTDSLEMVEIQRTSAFFFVFYGIILMFHKHVLTVLGKKLKEFSKRKRPVPHCTGYMEVFQGQNLLPFPCLYSREHMDI